MDTSGRFTSECARHPETAPTFRGATMRLQDTLGTFPRDRVHQVDGPGVICASESPAFVGILEASRHPMRSNCILVSEELDLRCASRESARGACRCCWHSRLPSCLSVPKRRARTGAMCDFASRLTAGLTALLIRSACESHSQILGPRRFATCPHPSGEVRASGQATRGVASWPLLQRPVLFPRPTASSQCFDLEPRGCATLVQEAGGLISAAGARRP